MYWWSLLGVLLVNIGYCSCARLLRFKSWFCWNRLRWCILLSCCWLLLLGLSLLSSLWRCSTGASHLVLRNIYDSYLLLNLFKNRLHGLLLSWQEICHDCLEGLKSGQSHNTLSYFFSKSSDLRSLVSQACYQGLYQVLNITSLDGILLL